MRGCGEDYFRSIGLRHRVSLLPCSCVSPNMASDHNMGFSTPSNILQKGVGRLPLKHLALLMLLSIASSLYAQPLDRFEFSRPLMGTLFNVVVYAPDSALASRASLAAFSRIDTLNQHFSDFLTNSEIYSLSRTAGSGVAIPVSDVLWTVLNEAQRLSALSGGAFDVTIGPLSRLWRRAIRRSQLPQESELEQARQTVGYRHLQLDAAAQTVRLALPDMRLDLGGLAKGFAADEAMNVLYSFGLTSALVDAGGDIVLGDPPPDTSGWRIAVSTVDPRGNLVFEDLYCSNTAIATSGDTYRFLEVDGVRYSHIIDPRTGIGVTRAGLVTVIAATGIRADALASTLNVLPPEEGLTLVSILPGTTARLIVRDDVRYRLVQSPGFAH